jgi:hypothetical protein
LGIGLLGIGSFIIMRALFNYTSSITIETDSNLRIPIHQPHATLPAITSVVSGPFFTDPPPTLLGINPSNGPDGTEIILTGTGFTSSNKIDVGINTGGFVQYGVVSSNGKSLTITVPGSDLHGEPCKPGGCGGTGSGSPGIPPGTYPVSVENTNGTSNSLNFTVTCNTISTKIGRFSCAH